MDNKKAIIDKAKENGVLERVSMLLSAAYLLNSESSMLVEEASDVLSRNGMRMGEIKMFHQRFTKSADMYFNCFATMIKAAGQENAYFKDFDEFDKVFRKWAKLD